MDYLKDAGIDGLIADEAIKRLEDDEPDGRPKVNRVAPIFTFLKQTGAVQQIGRRATRNGKSATVFSLVSEYEIILKEQNANSKNPNLFCQGTNGL